MDGTKDKTIALSLKQIGLTENEITVYLAMLGLGDSLASRIAEKAGMNRTHTYDVIESLVRQGLASYVIRNNRKYFIAANPNKLVDNLKEKENDIKQQQEMIKDILPQLITLNTKESKKTNVEIYHGTDGIKSIYNDILKKAKEYYLMGGTGKIADVLRYYFPNHERARIKKKIKLIALFNESLRKDKSLTERRFAKVRFLPSAYSSPIPTLIYGNRLVILVWNEPLAIVIENKEIKESYLNYFNMLWKLSLP